MSHPRSTVNALATILVWPGRLLCVTTPIQFLKIASYLSFCRLLFFLVIRKFFIIIFAVCDAIGAQSIHGLNRMKNRLFWRGAKLAGWKMALLE
jgi:hypothetical protein